MDRICKWCNEPYNELTGKNFSNHVRWCVKNPSRNEYNKEPSKKLIIKKYGEINDYVKICKTCRKSFSVMCREKDLHNAKYASDYCNRSCANSRHHSDETKEKMRTSIIEYRKTHKLPVRLNNKPNTKECKCCGTSFSAVNHVNKVYCSKVCRQIKNKENKRNNLSEIKQYKLACKFNFSLNTYPNEFDFDLIRTHGWYKAKNRGDNLNGVSRDHMIPIMYGWRNKISSDIIAHPANCQLLRHNDNVSKYTTPSISLEELIYRIETWNERYK